MNFGITEIILIVFVLAIFLLPFVLFLWTQHSTLREVHAVNRRIQPSEVWLQLVPLFGLVWQFIVVSRIADSLRDEFHARSISVNEERPGHFLGMAYCILFLCGILPYIGLLTILAGFVCWIIYWVKISGFKNRLRSQAL